MIETIQNRRSIRKYEDRPVEEETLLQILDCGRLAPSDANTQPWNFIIVRYEKW
jgi:nitroreductase